MGQSVAAYALLFWTAAIFMISVFEVFLKYEHPFDTSSRMPLHLLIMFGRNNKFKVTL